MIIVISGTNNSNNKTKIFAQHIVNLLKSKTAEPIHLLALDEIAHDYFYPEMFKQPAQSILDLQAKHLIPSDKFIILSPEYNGGIPGVLKLFIDACSANKRDDTFKRKKVALIGIASGRAGNLRGMDQLTGILNHLGTIVMPNKLPISSIHQLMNEKNEITDTSTLSAMNQQVDDFLAF